MARDLGRLVIAAPLKAGGRMSMAAMLAAVALIFACNNKPTAGANCTTANAATCLDGQNLLLCRGGIWETIPCRGGKGCDKSPKGEFKCDDEVANEGDACTGSRDGHYACSTDRKRGLICKDNKFQLWRHCRGPKACAIAENTVHCDTSLSEPGDACGQGGGHGCSTDHKMLMMCEDGKWKTVSSCRGPKGCVFTENDNRAFCDDTLALEGDPCDTPDERTCSVDGRAELVCKNRKFAKKQDCKRKDGCIVRPGEILCTKD